MVKRDPLGAGAWVGISTVVASVWFSLTWESCETRILALALVNGLFASFADSALLQLYFAFAWADPPPFSALYFDLYRSFGQSQLFDSLGLLLSLVPDFWLDRTWRMSLVLFAQYLCWVLHSGSHVLGELLVSSSNGPDGRSGVLLIIEAISSFCLFWRFVGD